MNAPTKIVPQDKQAAKLAKLKGDKIILATKVANQEKNAALHALQGKKDVLDLFLVKIKIENFDVLNTPQRDLNPSQQVQRLVAQAEIKANESRLLMNRAEMIEVNHPEFFLDAEDAEDAEVAVEVELMTKFNKALKKPVEPVGCNEARIASEEPQELPDTVQHDGENYTGMTEISEAAAEPVVEPEESDEAPSVEPEPDNQVVVLTEKFIPESAESPIEQLPKANQIIHITTVDEAIAAQEQLLQTDLPNLAQLDYMQIYCVTKDLFNSYFMGLSEINTSIQDFIGELEDVVIAPDTKVLFIIEPEQAIINATPQDTVLDTEAEELKQAITQAIEQWIDDSDVIHQGAAGANLSNIVREHLIAECEADEGILINSTIDYSYDGTRLAVVAYGKDSNGQYIIHSTTYSLQGDAEKITRKEYKTLGAAAEKHMRKCLGKENHATTS